MAEARKVLVDTSIWNASVTHEWLGVDKVIDWGPIKQRIIIPEPFRRILPGYSRISSEEIFGSLERIAQSEKCGKLRLFTTLELDFEEFGLPNKRAAAGSEFCLLHECKIEKLPRPVDRVVGWRFDDAPERFRYEKDEFLHAIKHERFMQMRKRTGNHHLADLFHLWSAEINEIEFYLTLDRRFMKSLFLPKPFATPVKLITPQELAFTIKSA